MNCQSAVKTGALDSLKMYCLYHHVDLLLLSETWFNEIVCDAELSFDNEFLVFRCDRPSRGGGVCVLARKHLKVVRIDVEIPGEFVTLDVITNGWKFRLLCCYISNSGLVDLRLNRVKNICHVIKSISVLDDPLLVIGDFNMPRICWQSAFFPEGETSESLFFNTCEDENLFQMINEATHKAGGILDLLLTSCPELISDMHIFPAPIPSDHYAIGFNILCENHFPILPIKLNYRHIDEAAVATHLNSIDWYLFFSGCGNVNEMYTTFVDCCTFLINQFTPVAHPSSAACKIKAYIDRIQLKLFSCSSENDMLSKKLKKAALRYRYIIESTLKLKDSRTFYQYVNSRIKGHVPVGVLQVDSVPCVTSASKASALASHFSSVFIAEYLPQNRHFETNVTISCIDHPVDFSEFVVYKNLTKLKSNANHTPDHIPSVFYKKFALFLAKPLSLIYQRSYYDGTVPNVFCESIVTPIHKKGSKCSAANYRPVAQGSIACKVIEKILSKHLFNYLQKNMLFDCHQHGFVANLSTCTQLLTMTQDWAMFINSGLSFHCVYFDQKNAFDKIPHDLLLRKMQVLGIGEQTVHWCKSYLSNRSFKVKVDDSLSESFPAPTGVPQGSCLSPLLYTIFISDIRKYIPNGVHYLAYADDLKVYCPIFAEASHTLLQSAVDGVARWCYDNGMLLSPSKCVVMKHGSHHYDYFLGGKALPSADITRDLGILISPSLDFSEHLSQVIKSASIMIGTIFRCFSSRNAFIYIHYINL